MREVSVQGQASNGEVLLPGTRSTALPVHARHARRERIRLPLLVLLDASMASLGFVLAYVLRYSLQVGGLVTAENQQPFGAFLPTLGLLVGAMLVVLTVRGLYRLPRNSSWLSQMGTIMPSCMLAVAFTIVATFIVGASAYSRLIFAFALAGMIITVGLGRLMVVKTRQRRWRSGRELERVLVVGGTGLARQVMTNLEDRETLGYDLVGCVADKVVAAGDNGDTPAPLGQVHELDIRVAEYQVDRVIVALPFWEHERLPEIVRTCNRLGVPFNVVPDFYDLSFDRLDVQDVHGIPLLELRENMIRGWNYVLKRTLDVGLVVLTLPLWGSLSLLLMVLIRLDSPGGAIFSQTRIGRNGRPFEFLKFRTMVANAEALKADLLSQNEGSGPMFKLRRDPRTTRVGRWLRQTSLDEIPQLWNVLRGDMSLVGPRPAVPEEVDQYESWQRRRLEVTPGCTGLWQATGRSNMPFEQMVRLDIYYAEHWSIGLDVKILLMSIPAILSGHGAF
ncbi:MAG: sugar transferase [Herpetosiphon sp.]